MNIKTSAYLAVAFCIATIACGTGCNENSVSDASSKSDKLPKMSFHKPRNFGLAVGRLREIHDLMVAEGELPAPISYTVVEVRHAHADGESHAHYHLVHDESHDHHDHDHDDHGDHDDHDHGDHEAHHDDHDHEEAFDEEKITHTVRVEIFTELNDIARWLPGIASDSDMAAAQWKKVDAASSELTATLESILANGEEKAKREQYRGLAKDVGATIEKLEAIVKPSAAKIL